MNSYSYPFIVEDNGDGGFIVSFKDIPEALTEVWAKNDIKQYALDALITSIEFYIEENKAFPKASKVTANDDFVTLPASVVSKVLLLNAMAQQHVRPIDLAKKMNIKPQEVNRITNLKHSSKIDTIERALNALGQKLTISCSWA